MSHSLFSKIIVGAGSGTVLASLTLTTVFILNDNGSITLRDDNNHYYNAKFYVEDSLVYSETLLKGSYLEYAFSGIPTKGNDADGTFYVFTGWDLLGNGLVDIVPAYIYSDINAHAVFTGITPPEIDLSKIDLYELLQLLESLDIDPESFINFFGLDLEDLNGLLDQVIIEYTTDYTGIVYLRTESFGNYNERKYKWNEANYFTYDGFVDKTNPLLFSGNIISQNQNPYTFDIKYLKGGNKFPVLCYETSNDQELQTDSYSLTNPVDKEYSSTGYPFLPATEYSVTLGQQYNYTKDNYNKDEKAYRKYVRDNYLTISDRYKDFFLNLSKKEGINFNGTDYGFLDDMSAFFMQNYSFNYTMKSYPRNQDPVIYFMNEAHEGIGRHFASASTLRLRALGVPARYCQGYISYSQEAGTTGVNPLQSHSWTEIYVDGIGWMQFDTALYSLAKDVFPNIFNYNIGKYDDYGMKNVTRIEAIPDEKEQTFFVGDVFSYNLLKVYAYYDDGTQRKVIPTKVYEPKLTTKGTKNITVIYNEGDNTVFTTYQIEVIEPTIISIELDTRNAKTKFYKGDTFEIIGVLIYANYNNGKKILYNGEYTYVGPSPDDMVVVGEYEVTISIEDNENTFSASYSVKVLDSGVKAINIYNVTGKNVYELNEVFDESSVEVELVFSEGGTQLIPFDSERMKLKDFSTVKSGTYSFKIIYLNDDGIELESQNSIDYIVDVVKYVELIYHGLTNANGKEFNGGIFDIGSNLDTNLLEVKLTFLSGRFEYASFNEENMRIVGFSSKKSGENYEYYLEYTNKEGAKIKSNKLKYLVNQVKAVEISSSRDDGIYSIGEAFNYNELVIKLIYLSGEERYVSFDSSNMRLENFDSNRTGESKYKLIYTTSENVEISSNEIPYTVPGLSGVKIESTKEKEEYYLKEEIDISKLKITLIDTNNTPKEVSFDPSTMRIVGFDTSTPGDNFKYKLIYTYEGYDYESNEITYKVNDLPTLSITDTSFNVTYGDYGPYGEKDSFVNLFKSKIKGVLSGDSLSLTLSKSEEKLYKKGIYKNLILTPTIYRNGVDVTTTKYKNVSTFTIKLKVAAKNITITTLDKFYNQKLYTEDGYSYYSYDKDGNKAIEGDDFNSLNLYSVSDLASSDEVSCVINRPSKKLETVEADVSKLSIRNKYNYQDVTNCYIVSYNRGYIIWE